MKLRDKRFPRVTEYFGHDLCLDDFEHIEKLGKGTFGQVELYRYRPSGSEYAIKRIQLVKEGKKTNSREEIETLTRKQLEILYKLDNPYIIKLIDHFQDDQAVYLITQFIPGLNLYAKTLNNNHHLSLQQIADIAYQLAESLEELHSNHIIHRDIKLENIMYNNERVKVVDLGCSNFYAEGISRQTTIGTKLYWSPEIIGQEEQNDRLDIWCVGVVLFELLYLEEPFAGSDIERKIRKCDYSFPGERPQPELEDLFKRIFTHKSKRMSALELKEHKYRKQVEEKNYRYEMFFNEEETGKYRELIRNSVIANGKFVEGVRGKTGLLGQWLKEAKKQLRKK